MKIKRDFVTNSSSTCFIFDRRELTEEEIDLLGDLILKAPLAEYYRNSQCLNGIDLQEYIENLKEEKDEPNYKWLYTFAMTLLGYLTSIGIGNIIMLVDGEDYRGLEQELPHELFNKSKTEYDF